MILVAIGGDIAVIKDRNVKMYAATINKDALKPRSRNAFYSRQKLLLILVATLVSVIPLVGISYFSFQYYRNSSIEHTSVELASLAGSRKELIDLFLAEQDNRLASLMALYPPEYLSQQTNLEKVFNATNGSGVMTDLGVIDGAGDHLAYVGPFREQLAGRNYSGADWFAQVMRDGEYTSDIFSGFRGVPHIIVAAANPEKTMILRATVNSDSFNSLLAGAEVGSGGDAFILNSNGEAQTPSRLNDQTTPFSLADVSAAGSTSVFQTPDFIYAATSLNNGDWVLVLKEDIQSSLAEFYNARNRAIVLITLAIVLITTTAVLTISSMINRIQLADQQRTALNNRVLEAERMALIGRLASSVSHEINNPLQIIENQAGWIGELLEDEKGPRSRNYDEYLDAVAKIRAHVGRAKTITHKLLGFSRAHEADRAGTDINRLINETVSFLEHEAGKNRIQIEKHLDAGLPEVTTDPSELQQVFLNIVNNAIDAVGHDGKITISTWHADGSVVTEIADTGPGLEEEVLRRLYDPFFTTKKGTSSGLGLSISYNIIQRLGGDIKARNREQGGSIFTVTLPVAAAEADQKHSEE